MRPLIMQLLDCVPMGEHHQGDVLVPAGVVTYLLGDQVCLARGGGEAFPDAPPAFHSDEPAGDPIQQFIDAQRPGRRRYPGPCHQRGTVRCTNTPDEGHAVAGPSECRAPAPAAVYGWGTGGDAGRRRLGKRAQKEQAVTEPNASLPATIEEWLSSTSARLDLARRAGWNDFADRYEALLRAAGEQIPTMSDRLRDLVRSADHLKPHQFLFKYVEAMSVSVGREHIFLPSFSDQCLWDVVKDSPTGLSPLRGLYYAWKMSEIAYLFQGPPSTRKLAFDKLQDLMGPLSADYAAQAPGADYRRYEAVLRDDQQDRRWNNQIESTKRAIRSIASPLKWHWIHLYPYPCTTSSHFYLSGMRFYHNAHLGTATDFPSDDRYSVHSTDSGLVSPVERYGILMPSGADAGVADKLLAEIPPGSLLLDLSRESATSEDRANLPYFENWSRLVTAKAYYSVAETLSIHAYSKTRTRYHRNSTYSNLARAYYLEDLTKNPMRTFYFDTGILGAARLAIRSGLPKVQYVTTRHTKVAKGKAGAPSRRMLDSLFDGFGDGIEFYYVDSADWPEPGMAAWTLVPIGDKLPTKTSCIWSIRRADSRKISHGLEGLRRDAYLQNVVSPGELMTEGVEAVAGGIFGGAVLPGQVVTGVILGGLLGTGLNVKRVRDRTTNIIQAISDVPRNPTYSRINESAQFPLTATG